MANGIGVSVSQRVRKGKTVWVVRWRELVEEGGEKRWASRQRTCSTE